MSGVSLSDILAMVIGMVFIYLLLSIFTTWIQELIAQGFKIRSKGLVNIFQNMLDPDATQLEGVKKLKETWKKGDTSVAQKISKNAVKALYEHPIIESLSPPGTSKLPSYISSRDFTIALFDLLAKAGTDDPTQLEITIDSLKEGINNIENQALKERLLSLVNSASVAEDNFEHELVAFRDNVQRWFDSSMERATGWYKRKSLVLGFIIGLLVAILFNADTISISQSLWQDSALREAATEAAEDLLEGDEQTKSKDAQELLGELGLPLGWSFQFPDDDPETPENHRDYPNTVEGWILKILGLFITGLAISQGSSLWFDVLGRLINIRSSGGKPAPEAAGATESPKVQLEITGSSLVLPNQTTGGGSSSNP
jgi:hypothetical protein